MGTLGRLLTAVGDGFFADFRLRRRMRKAPRAELGSLAENTFARITGTVRPNGKRLLEAPLSGRLCAYYSVTVIAASEHLGQRTTIGSEEDALTFVVDDGSGRAVIDPAHAVISAAFDFLSESMAAFDADPQQRATLERMGLVRRNWFTTDLVQYREAIIEIDEVIAVYGAGVRELDPDAAPTGMYRDSGPQRMRFTGTAKHPLLISDDPRTL